MFNTWLTGFLKIKKLAPESQNSQVQHSRLKVDDFFLDSWYLCSLRHQKLIIIRFPFCKVDNLFI